MGRRCAEPAPSAQLPKCHGDELVRILAQRRLCPGAATIGGRRGVFDCEQGCAATDNESRQPAFDCQLTFLE